MSSDKIKIVNLGKESFLQSGNALINLSQVKGIEETKGKCIYFYFGMFSNSYICENASNKEGYNMVKKVLGFN